MTKNPKEERKENQQGKDKYERLLDEHTRKKQQDVKLQSVKLPSVKGE
jgi:hypothetical protein